MPATYEPIATTTLSSAASTITFSSIGAGYTDLRLVLVGQTNTGTNAIRTQFNSDTGTNYSITRIIGDGASATSSRVTSTDQISLGNMTSAAGVICLHTLDIFSYAGSTNKTVLATASEDANGSGNVRRTVGLWRNTAAITSISLFIVTNSFNAGTTATLYGILKA